MNKETTFYYMDHATFAPDAQLLEEITHVSVFLDREPAGIHGIQVHFDDREPVPQYTPGRGKGVPVLINGAGGERMHKLVVLWSEASHCTGLKVRTTHDIAAFF